MSDNTLKGAADYGLRHPAATLLNEEGAFDGHVVEAPLAHDLEKKSGFKTALAAMLLLSVGGLGGRPVRGALQASPEGLVALAQEATASYNVYAPDRVRPVEVRASDATQLVEWVSGRLHRPVKVPDLTNSGYRLMGGRLVATEHGPAAMFMYDDDHGSRIVVLTRPMSSADQNAPMTPRSQGDVGGFAWADDGVSYSLVGHAAPESLRPIANEVRRQARAIQTLR